MTIPYANAIGSAADFALNSYISPRYARLDKDLQAPAQPAPAFFGIWTPIFAGRIAYGLAGAVGLYAVLIGVLLTPGVQRL